MTTYERASEIANNELIETENKKFYEVVDAAIAAFDKKENKKMALAPNTITRILENITQETAELSRADYIEVLEELKDDIETRLDAAQDDEAREQREESDAAIEGEERG